MKYREHRGQLSDSMATQVEVNSMQELLDHINKGWNCYDVNFNNVSFKYVGFDERINQETYYVIGFEVREIVLGMSDSDTFEKQ